MCGYGCTEGGGFDFVASCPARPAPALAPSSPGVLCAGRQAWPAPEHARGWWAASHGVDTRGDSCRAACPGHCPPRTLNLSLALAGTQPGRLRHLPGRAVAPGGRSPPGLQPRAPPRAAGAGADLHTGAHDVQRLPCRGWPGGAACQRSCAACVACHWLAAPPPRQPRHTPAPQHLHWWGLLLRGALGDADVRHVKQVRAQVPAGPDAEGWFRTGDVGKVLPNGAVHLLDREANIWRNPRGVRSVCARWSAGLRSRHARLHWWASRLSRARPRITRDQLQRPSCAAGDLLALDALEGTYCKAPLVQDLWISSLWCARTHLAWVCGGPAAQLPDPPVLHAAGRGKEPAAPQKGSTHRLQPSRPPCAVPMPSAACWRPWSCPTRGRWRWWAGRRASTPATRSCAAARASRSCSRRSWQPRPRPAACRRAPPCR